MSAGHKYCRCVSLGPFATELQAAQAYAEAMHEMNVNAKSRLETTPSPATQSNDDMPKSVPSNYPSKPNEPMLMNVKKTPIPASLAEHDDASASNEKQNATPKLVAAVMKFSKKGSAAVILPRPGTIPL